MQALSKALPVGLPDKRRLKFAPWLRMRLCQTLFGENAWPLVFRAPESLNEFIDATSPNLYVHLPFCESLCPHCPCNKELYSLRSHARYADALRRELRTYARGRHRARVRTLRFGGGTPSLTPHLVEVAMATLRPLLERDAQVVIEVHPKDASPVLFQRLKEAAVNRVRLCVETFDLNGLLVLGRTYSEAEAIVAVARARQAGFECLDVSLLSGIPGQGDDQTELDVSRAIELGADQVTVHPFSFYERTPLGQALADGKLSSVSRREIASVHASIDRLCADAGYVRTSMVSFARPDAPPFYSAEHEDHIGFGAGADSKVGGRIWLNTFSVEEYSSSSEHRPALALRVTDRFCRFHWFAWQIYDGKIHASRYREAFDRSLFQDFGYLLHGLRLLGLVRKRKGFWELSKRGAVWAHRTNVLFSAGYIDALWSRCQDEPWPEEVVLT